MNEKQRNHSPASFSQARLLSIVSVAFALYLMGLFLMLGLLSRELATYVKENIVLSVVLNEQLSDTDARQLQRQISTQPYVKSARYISKQQAVAELTEELGEDPSQFLGFNPFSASIEIRLKSEYADAENLPIIERQLTAYRGVAELVFQQDVLQQVDQNIRHIGIGLLGLMLILTIISFVLISNTIKLLIYSRRFLIYTMRLVGATNGFIRRPFIRYSIVSGLIAGVIAGLMLAGTQYAVQYGAGGVVLPIDLRYLAVVYGSLPVVGMLLAAAASALAVNRYLRMNRGKMYYI